MTVGELREFILGDERTRAPEETAWAITPEIAAAVAKLNEQQRPGAGRQQDTCSYPMPQHMGERGVLGIRLQPNHPADDAAGILLSAFDGLLYGCGDAVIGVNPATDAVESVSAILHALNRLIEATGFPPKPAAWPTFPPSLKRWSAARRGPAFQSVAGTQKANESFGVTLSMLREDGNAC